MSDGTDKDRTQGSTAYPVERGWVGEGVPYLSGSRRRMLQALQAGSDLSGGEATAPISPETAETVIAILRRRGFRPEALVRMRRRELQRVAEGEAAVDAYLAEVMKPHGDHFHWSRALIFIEPQSASRFIVDTDEDGTVLELLCWGVKSHPVLTEVIEELWRQMRQAQTQL